MFRSLFHDKRGVSEIVANLIVILIVSVAGVALYSYSLGTFSFSSSSFQLQTSDKEELARERISIINVWWNTENRLNLTMLNYGKIELVIDAVYINGTKVSISGGEDTVGAGELISISAFPVSVNEGDTCEIIAVSERGGKDAVYWKA